jgi:glycosyltransferase involved in cell wall biosynthesis
MRERYHAELEAATVISSNVSLLAFEARARAKRLKAWSLILARNEWFQRQALRALEKFESKKLGLEIRGVRSGQKTTANMAGTTGATDNVFSDSSPILFAYSYAARDLFRWAKDRGWLTVLGQIDAGPEMRRIVQHLEQCHPEYQSQTDSPPGEYWIKWREECALADRIVVNSEWSLKALEMEGIAAEKIRIVPLAYAPPLESTNFQRQYPQAFSAQRPMQVLFLGQVNLAKGLVPLLEAAEILKDQPVEFQIVGPVQVVVPEHWRHHPKIRWLGPVPRGTVAEHYRAADVFLFPTFSDGFGLTQLEAQAWQLPIVASRFCGDVVKDGVNGLQLSGVSAADIARALRKLLASPEKLSAMARASNVDTQFSLAGIATRFESVLD